MSTDAKRLWNTLRDSMYRIYAVNPHAYGAWMAAVEPLLLAIYRAGIQRGREEAARVMEPTGLASIVRAVPIPTVTLDDEVTP